MTERLLELLELVTRDGWWVPLDTYLALYPGEKKKTVLNRRSAGIWQDGVHSKYVKGGGVWVNLIAVNSWVAKSALRLVSPSEKTAMGIELESESASCTAASNAASASTSPPARRTSATR